jgi:hypothetical protein
MLSMYPKTVDFDEQKRSTLKKIGVAGAALPFGAGLMSAPVSAANTNTPVKKWEHSVDFPVSGTSSSYHTSVIAWYGSDLISRGWVHDFSLTGLGSTQWDSGLRVNDITRNFYKFWPEDYQEDGRVPYDATAGRYGMYPPENEDYIPEGIQVPLEYAISAYYAPAGFIIAFNDLVDALTPENGFTSIKSGKGFKNLATPKWYQNNWSDISHYQRVLYESGQSSSVNDMLHVRSELGRGTNGSAFKSTIDYEIYCWRDDVPNLYKSGSSSAALTSNDLTTSEDTNGFVSPTSGSPEKMKASERRKFGIEKYNPKKHGVRKVLDETPSHVATRFPLAIGVTTTTTDENGDIVDVDYTTANSLN